MIQQFVWILIIGIISIFMFFKIIIFNHFQKKDPEASLSTVMTVVLGLVAYLWLGIMLTKNDK